MWRSPPPEYAELPNAAPHGGIGNRQNTASPMTHAPKSSDRTIHLRPPPQQKPPLHRSTQSRAYGVGGSRGAGPPGRGSAAAGWRRRFRQGLSESGRMQGEYRKCQRIRKNRGSCPQRRQIRPVPFFRLLPCPRFIPRLPVRKSPPAFMRSTGIPPMLCRGNPLPPSSSAPSARIPYLATKGATAKRPPLDWRGPG